MRDCVVKEADVTEPNVVKEADWFGKVINQQRLHSSLSANEVYDILTAVINKLGKKGIEVEELESVMSKGIKKYKIKRTIPIVVTIGEKEVPIGNTAEQCEFQF